MEHHNNISKSEAFLYAIKELRPGSGRWAWAIGPGRIILMHKGGRRGDKWT
jgi:hypothetical protein